MEHQELTTRFHQFFKAQLADSEAMRERIYRMRYEVYCREFGYEREEDCPGGLERDDYDASASHCALIHRSTAILAGSVRVVPPSANAEPGGYLPMDRYCGNSLDHPSLHPALMSADTFCEVSRLAVPSTFRRRSGEEKTPLGAPESLVFSRQEIRTFPLIAVTLFLAATALVSMQHRPHVFAMMEPRLARMLSRSGLHFVRIGRLIDYHGQRAAYYIHQADAVTSMRPELRSLYDEVSRALAAPKECSHHF